jgi:hypothetical protein
LSSLTKEQAAACIKRLADDRPTRGYSFHRGRRALDRGEIRFAGDATNRQRRTIHGILNDLGWPAEQCGHWLWSRHHVKDLDNDRIDRGRASDIIKQLLAALTKVQPQITPMHTDSDPEAEVPGQPDPCLSVPSVANPLESPCPF